MNIAQRWINYCEGEVNYATEDEWVNFVQMVFAEWQHIQVQDDSNCENAGYRDFSVYVEEKYSFDKFYQCSGECKELVKLASQRQGSQADAMLLHDSSRG